MNESKSSKPKSPDKSREESFKEELKKLGILSKLEPFRSIIFNDNINELNQMGVDSPDFEDVVIGSYYYDIYRFVDVSVSPQVCDIIFRQRKSPRSQKEETPK